MRPRLYRTPKKLSLKPPLPLPAILGSLFLAFLAQAASAETKSYVIGFVMPAGYAYDGDCEVHDPVPEPGRTTLQSFVRKKLLEAGKTPEEIDKLVDTLDVVDAAIVDPITFRGRINGKPVNVLGNPESVPDPQIHTVTGKYAYGFNLDGKGADDPTSFENPETHEKGVDNQFYRASGCTRTLRVSYPVMPAPYVDTLAFNATRVPAVLITVSGEDLSKDGEVTVTFNRAIEYYRDDALSNARRDMTFRVDPNPRTRSAFRGRIENGALHVKGGHLELQGKFFAAPFDLTSAQLRLKMMPDGSLDGMIGGYQSWHSIYYFYFNTVPAAEYGYAIDMPGMYYALRRLADADPDPVTGENRRISVTYGIKAVPAFITNSRNGVGQSLAAVVDGDNDTPRATPLGITIQTPSGGGTRFLPYRRHSQDSRLLADANGMTLYTYDNDKSGRSTCYDACAQEWPPLIAPKGAKAFGDWTLAKRRDGRRQWAYLGMPLYRFAKDTIIGEAAGVPKPEEKPETTVPVAAVPAPEPEPKGPWKVASYKLAAPLTPYGVSVGEIGDANGEGFRDIAHNTLYTFDGDSNDDHLTCRATPCDASLWIPFAAGRLANPVGDFSIVRRKDGVSQWAYKGKTLYRYKHDTAPGHAKGIGVDKRWRVALVREFYRPPGVYIQESLGRGKVLTDEKGMTLYRRSAALSEGPPRSLPVCPEEGRVIGTGSCDQDCMKTWIPFEAPADAQSTGYWQVVARNDGKRQWSYKGYALYRYAGDEKPGDVNGTHIFDVFFNADVKTDLSPAEKTASSLKTPGQIALMWSHVYP